MTELLPCPFCGQPPNVERQDAWITYARCYDCNIVMPLARWNRRAGGWVPVAERLPAEGEWVLGYGEPWKDEPPCRLVRYDQDEKLFDDGIGHILGVTRITHWRLLPPPPQAD